MKKIILLICVLFCSLAITSCGDDEEQTNETVVTPTEKENYINSSNFNNNQGYEKLFSEFNDNIQSSIIVEYFIILGLQVFLLIQTLYIQSINFYFDRILIKNIDSIKSLLYIAITQYTYKSRYIDLLNIFDMMRNNYSFNQIVDNLTTQYN